MGNQEIKNDDNRNSVIVGIIPFHTHYTTLLPSFREKSVPLTLVEEALEKKTF